MDKGVHAAKPWVRVGISPFGIWRPGNPAQIKGFDAYAEIYADSKKWLQNGWADYFVPQLYWPIAPPDQSFPVLYDWWLSQNTKHRHMWPGLATYRISETGQRRITSQEIVAEIDTMRARNTSLGHIHFNMTALMKGPDSLNERLLSRYAFPALVPASPWLGAKAPGAPSARIVHDTATGDLVMRLTPAQGGGERVWLWTVRSYANGRWVNEVLPGWLRAHRLAESATTRVVVTAVSRTGVESRSVEVRVP